jgi:hypothetical protein
MDTQAFLLIILTAFFSMAAIIAVISYPSMDKYKRRCETFVPV